MNYKYDGMQSHQSLLGRLPSACFECLRERKKKKKEKPELASAAHSFLS